MSLLGRIANGLGTLLGVLAETTTQVISGIKSSYEAYKKRGGSTKDVAKQEAERKKDRLRAVNDEIMDLRNRRMSRGTLSDQERRRWQNLRDERDSLLTELNQAKEVKTAEKILDGEQPIEKVEIQQDSTHILQYNAFADTLGKACPKCGRQMKLQWKRAIAVAGLNDFFWGCTGWYALQGAQKACTHKEPFQRNDFGLMTDTAQPEFSLTADQFGIILDNQGTANLIAERVDDLKADLSKSGHGVELASCPVHGENMVLKRKDGATGLLDSYFLACPYWLPHNQGCTFIEKLKSGSQLAALLKSQTGRGIL